MEVAPGKYNEKTMEAKQKKNNEGGSSSHASDEVQYDVSPTGGTVIGNTLVTKMKILKK